MELCITDNPNDLDRMGNLVQKEERLIEEGPPRVNRPELRPTTSVWVQRVLIDDNTKVLYKREESGTEFYYLRQGPPDHTTIDEKVIYSFVNTMEGIFGDVVFLDKYNQEWELKVPSELRGLTQNGISIMRQEIDLGGPSNLNFPTPGTFYVPPPSPSYTYTPRPVPTPMRVSFADTRPPLGPYGPRPMGSGIMYGSSGHPATGVPI